MSITRLRGTCRLMPSAALVAGLVSATAHALPMGSQGTWMIMGDFTRDGQELAANYAVTRQDAFEIGRAHV